MPDEVNTPQTPKPAQMIINTPVATQLTYGNGAILNVSQSDVQIIFTLNGRPVSTVALALPTAKTLYASLSKAISDYERKTEMKVFDLGEIAELMKKP